MSTPDAKNSTPKAKADTPAQAATGSPGAVATAMVQPKAPTAPTDQFRGQGGLYTMKNGKRVRVATTADETTKEPQ